MSDWFEDILDTLSDWVLTVVIAIDRFFSDDDDDWPHGAVAT